MGAGIIIVEEDWLKVYSAGIIRKSKYKTVGFRGRRQYSFFSVVYRLYFFYQFRETSFFSFLLDVIEGKRCIIRKNVEVGRKRLIGGETLNFLYPYVILILIGLTLFSIFRLDPTRKER